jgi:endonuclease YncB( thermonuclease family)
MTKTPRGAKIVTLAIMLLTCLGLLIVYLTRIDKTNKEDPLVANPKQQVAINNHAKGTSAKANTNANIIVIDVIDADTLVIQRDGIIERVRLAGIDAPEIGTPLYQESTLFVKKWIETHNYKINFRAKDHYSRSLVTITAPEESTEKENDLGETILKKGFAKTRFLPKDLRPSYKAAEKVAKNNFLGVWAKD